MNLKKFLFSVLLIFSFNSYIFAQKADTTSTTVNFFGALSVTNNGISLLPSFSLGKPALMLEMSMGNRLTFDPQFRVSLEGQPWAFIFWWRYKLIKDEKFTLNVGAHPAVTFRTETPIVNGIMQEYLVPKRYLAAEIAPNYQIHKNISVGLYYLTSHGFDINSTKNVHFITINSNISNLNLGRDFVFGLRPQFYYLKMDQNDGIYLTSTFTLKHLNFPLSLESVINNPFRTDIVGSDKFQWNISLIYSFKNSYVKSYK